MEDIPPRSFPGTHSCPPFFALVVALAFLGLACQKPANSDATAIATPTIVVDTAEALELARARIATAEQELLKRYLELDKRRLRLAKAAPAEVQSYNRDAATYSADRDALQRRQDAVQKLEQADAARRQGASAGEQSAQQTLSRLRAAINVSDWPAQVAAMEQALAQHRNTEAFAQISALARPRLAAVTQAEVEKAMANSSPAPPPRAAAPHPDALIQQLRSLINQPVQPVPKGEGRVGTYNFHPGGTPLDYARVTKDELWKARETYPQPMLEPLSHRGEYFRTEDVEFNILLKWYYADPTYPTKRLSDSDYDRIIELCRRIAEAQSPVSTTAAAAVFPVAPRASAAQLWPRIEALKRTWPR